MVGLSSSTRFSLLHAHRFVILLCCFCDLAGKASTVSRISQADCFFSD